MMYSNSDRSLASMVHATAMAVALCFALASPTTAADEPQNSTPAMTPAPTTSAKGEFGNSCTKAPEFVLAQDQAAQAQPPAANATPAAGGPTKSFTEEDVNAAVKKTVDERTKDGATSRCGT
jgi:hypothetical protein